MLRKHSLWSKSSERVAADAFQSSTAAHDEQLRRDSNQERDIQKGGEPGGSEQTSTEADLQRSRA